MKALSMPRMGRCIGTENQIQSIVAALTLRSQAETCDKSLYSRKCQTLGSPRQSRGFTRDCYLDSLQKTYAQKIREMAKSEESENTKSKAPNNK